MNIKKLVLGALATVALAVPGVSFADWHHDGWRAHEWREHGYWGPRYGAVYGYNYGWRPGVAISLGYAPHCWVENHGYYNWYGAYVYHPMRVCR